MVSDTGAAPAAVHPPRESPVPPAAPEPPSRSDSREFSTGRQKPRHSLAAASALPARGGGSANTAARGYGTLGPTAAPPAGAAVAVPTPAAELSSSGGYRTAAEADAAAGAPLLALCDAPVVVAAEAAHGAAPAGLLARCCAVPGHMTLGGMAGAMMGSFLPAAGVNFLYFCNQTVTMIFVGQALSVDGLAAYSVGLSVYNAAGASVCIGLATALDTLASQCYGRAPRGRELSELLYRSCFLCLCCTAVVVAGFFLGGPLLALVFGRRLGAGAGAFLRCAPLYLVTQVLAMCLQKALQAQRAGRIPLYAAAASAAACPVFNYCLTHLGVGGAAAALTLSSTTLLLVMIGLSTLDPAVVVWRARPSLKSLACRRGAAEFFGAGVPAFLMLAGEWWALEAMVTFAAHFGVVAVDGFTVGFNLLLLFFAVVQGMGTAVAVFTGNELGAGDYLAARSYARLGLLLTVAVAVADVGVMWLTSSAVFHLYTRDSRVVAVLNSVLPVLMLFHTVDGIAAALQGLFRGVGRQQWAARAVLAGLWLIGVPAAYSLSILQGWEVVGVFVGLETGALVEAIMMGADWGLRWDWAELARTAAKEGGSRRDSGKLDCGVTDEGDASEDL